MSYDSYIKKNFEISPDELYNPSVPKNKLLSLKQLIHSPLNRIKISPKAVPYKEGEDLNPTLHAGKLQVVEKDAIDTAYINMKDSNGKPILVDSQTLKPTKEELANRVAEADAFRIPGQKIEKSPIIFAEESVYEIRRVNDTLLKYSNQLHDKIINTDKVAELFIPLIRHSYLVVGFFHTKEDPILQPSIGQHRLMGADKAMKKYEKEDPIKDIKECINKLKSCEDQYTGLLKVVDVSIERVKELFNPLVKHANLILGLYSQRNPLPEGEILMELPEAGDKFIKVVKCNKAGVPIVTYHNILVLSKRTEGMAHHSFIELTISETSVDGNIEIAKEQEIIENVYQSDLSKWRFLK